MSALLVSEVSTRRDYWRSTAVTPTKIQSSWRRILVDRSYHIGPFLVGWSARTKPLPRTQLAVRQWSSQDDGPLPSRGHWRPVPKVLSGSPIETPSGSVAVPRQPKPHGTEPHSMQDLRRQESGYRQNRHREL